jgi:hypothetical protein
MDAGGTGLLTYAGTCSSMGWIVPFPRPSGFSGTILAGHSRFPADRKTCAFTVAGQWRSFTALPEHSVRAKIDVAQPA